MCLCKVLSAWPSLLRINDRCYCDNEMRFVGKGPWVVATSPRLYFLETAVSLSASHAVRQGKVSQSYVIFLTDLGELIFMK